MDYNMKLINLTCNESNIASTQIVKWLGCSLVEIIDLPKDYFEWYSGAGESKLREY